MLLFVTTFLAAHASGNAPVAEAGLGVLAFVGDTVELNGTGSTDPEGDELAFTWTQVGGPPVELGGAMTAKPKFSVTDPGTFRFQLVVNDGTADSPVDDVAVVVAYRSLSGDDGGCAVVPGAPIGLASLLAGLWALSRRR